MVAELEKIPFENGGGFRASWLNEKTGFWHFHPEFELVLNLKSYGSRIIGDNVELFDRYYMTLIAGNIPHIWNHYKTDGLIPRDHGIALHFSYNSLGEDLLAQYEMKALRSLLSEAERGIAFSVDDAMRAEKPLTDMINHTGIQKMIDFFNVIDVICSSDSRRLLCSEHYKPRIDDKAGLRMTEVYSFVRENFSRPITLKEASSVARMKPSSFGKFFKRSCGSGFVEYLNQVRTNKACYLLRETEFLVHDIAAECGFESISNFNKVFRKTMGISPTEYRSLYN